MDQERDYQAVYIKDLLFSILYRWKTVLIFMLIGALLLGGLHWLTVLTSPNHLKPNMTSDQLTQSEQVKQALEDTNMRIETQQAYLTTSPLMSIDPNNFYQATLTLYIHTDYKIQPGSTYQNPDSMPSLLAAYQQLLTDGEVIGTIAEETGLPGQYLDELITCVPVSSHPGILNITINADDEETAQLLLTLLTQVMENASANIATLTGKHTLSVQCHTPILCADTNIADMQEAAYKRLTSLQDQKIAWQKQQTSLSISGSEANFVLLAAIGAVIGAVLVIVVVCIGHIGSNKVYSVRTLKNRTGIKVLSCIKAPGKFGILQRQLFKLEGRCIHPNQLQVVTALLHNHCAKKNQIMLTSSSANVESQELLAALEAAKVSFVIYDSLIENPEALKALPQCDAVILLEQCHRSHVAQIEQTMQIIQDEGIALLGCVLLDG